MSDNTVMPIVRVAVLAAGEEGGRLTEMALPADLPLREILPAVARLAGPGEDADDPAHRPARLSLAPIGGAPFSLDATLDTVGVVDGDLLALQPLPAGPPAPRIVEDIADAAVIFSAARETRWGAIDVQRAAALAALTLIFAGTALGVTHRIVTGELIGLFAVSAVAVGAVLGSLLCLATSPRLATALGVAALAPVAAAFAFAVPGEFGAAQVLLAAAGVTAWSVISLTIGERGIAVFTATAATGFGILLAAAAASVWTVSGTVLGAVLIVIGLLVTVQSAQLSAMWARFPLPAIPAPGDPTPSAQPLRVLEDLPRRVRVSQSHQTGFLAAGMLLAVTGSLLLIGAQSGSPWAWYVVVAAAAGATLRARVWDSAGCKAWLLAHPFVLTVGLAVFFAATDRFAAAWWALLALVLLTAVWIVVALNPSIARPETYSLPARRLVGFLASAVDASLIPVLAYLVGLFSLVLDR
ncbi:type VII secretion integral membrane protein EccD [Mycobacterium sp. WMMD1722]|uniref:type VII secretion integral membrane protein EccD n=1 Tax=Mycobacterium sp. WMMD1722 TaxID=3404117 RepID=UPI003BF50C67